MSMRSATSDPEQRARVRRVTTSAILDRLRPWLQMEFADEPDTIIVEEFGLCRGRARIDLAAINGKLHGYEVKSDYDSLRRLPSQIAWYGMIFDELTLVVGTRSLRAALRILPKYWGIIHMSHEAGTGLNLTVVRGAQLNPERDARALAELLWAEHAIALLEQRNLARGVRGRPRRAAWERICEHFVLDDISAAVRARLKATVTQRGCEQQLLCDE